MHAILAPTAQAWARSPLREQPQLPALPADSVLACSVVLAAPGPLGLQLAACPGRRFSSLLSLLSLPCLLTQC